MKTRILSAIVALLIFIPIFIIGDLPYQILIYALAMLGLKEFLHVKRSKKEIPIFIEIISYVILTLLVFSNKQNSELIYTIDYRLIAGLFLVYLIPTVLYHDNNIFSINDAFYLIGGIFFLGTSFSLLILIRNISLNLLIYLFLITVITDTYAYITGYLIGKHKLLKEVSPNKTWEGMIGGTVFGVLVASVFYYNLIDANISIDVLVLMTLFLSIIGQFGDLAFSAIKRYFGVKDFSNIMPGHGGILDRFDSIIFVVLAFMFFINII